MVGLVMGKEEIERDERKWIGLSQKLVLYIPLGGSLTSLSVDISNAIPSKVSTD